MCVTMGSACPEWEGEGSACPGWEGEGSACPGWEGSAIVFLHVAISLPPLLALHLHVRAMVYSDYNKQRIIVLYQRGLSPSEISKALLRENLSSTRQGILKCIKRFVNSGSIQRKSGSGSLRSTKITDDVMRLVDRQMEVDDETTPHQLYMLLIQHGVTLSISTILRSRTKPGRTFRGSKYCQLIRAANVTERLEWARQYVSDPFDDVIWSDETTVQLQHLRRHCCRRLGKQPTRKPR